MAMQTARRGTTEERVSFLEGAYDHMPTKSDVFEVEKQLSAQVAKSRTELSDRITEARTESRTENAKLRTEMREGFAQLHTKIAESEARMTKANSDNQARTIGWVIAACVLAVTIVTAIDRIFG